MRKLLLIGGGAAVVYGLYIYLKQQKSKGGTTILDKLPLSVETTTKKEYPANPAIKKYDASINTIFRSTAHVPPGAGIQEVLIMEPGVKTLIV